MLRMNTFSNNLLPTYATCDILINFNVFHSWMALSGSNNFDFIQLLFRFLFPQLRQLNIIQNTIHSFICTANSANSLNMELEIIIFVSSIRVDLYLTFRYACSIEVNDYIK